MSMQKNREGIIMSRDFTPREQYLVSVKMDPSYFMLNAKIKYGPGDEEKDLYSEEEKNIIRSYPILGRSAPEFVLSVVDSCKENMAICFSLLQKMEDKLSVINTGESKCIDCFVKAWFDGELDSSFYYNKENNRLMKNYIMDEFELLKNIKTVQDWYCIAFPLDELGPKIPKTLAFDEIYEGLQNGIDIYTKLGAAADSIVRERIFEELSVRKGVDYNTVYQMWLDCEEEDLELDEKALEVIR